MEKVVFTPPGPLGVMTAVDNEDVIRIRDDQSAQEDSNEARGGSGDDVYKVLLGCTDVCVN